MGVEAGRWPCGAVDVMGGRWGEAAGAAGAEESVVVGRISAIVGPLQCVKKGLRTIFSRGVNDVKFCPAFPDMGVSS
jgi:hypothetical protein